MVWTPQIRTFRGVMLFAFAITAIGLVATVVFVNIAGYTPEMRAFVMPKALSATVLISLPLAAYCGWLLRRSTRLTDDLTVMVERDRLTDVATRDFFFTRLTEFPDAYGVSLMVDIDHFKRINDEHGHLAGDAVIRTVAQTMKSQLRNLDIICRFGGEEFVIFLHNATREQGWEVAERIRTKIQDDVMQTEFGAIKATVSIGGSLKERLEHIDQAIKRADVCLYRAKNAGRNRTVVDWRPDDAVPDKDEAAA